MTKEELHTYLETRREGWPYEGRYRVDRLDGHRFVAYIDGELAGLAWAEVDEGPGAGRTAKMRMNLKKEFAEFGIGTELMELLMADLRDAGFEKVRYETDPGHWSYQIYKNMGFEVESMDADSIRFVWRRSHSEN